MADKENSFQEIFNRIECDAGLIFVDTPEETRLIKEVFRKYRKHKINFWSIGYGMHEIDSRQDFETFLPSSNNFLPQNAKSGRNEDIDTRSSAIDALALVEEECREKIKPENEPAYKNVYILRDLDKFFAEPTTLRALRDLIYLASSSASTIIVTGHGITVPPDLEKDTCLVRLKYPTVDEIRENIIPAIRAGINETNAELPEDSDKRVDPNYDTEELVRVCAGLTEDQIINAIQYTTTVDLRINPDRILEEKKGIINKSDILEYWICDDKMDDIGGFDNLKEWLNEIKVVMDNPEEAEDFAVDAPKGILLLGIQGGGKTAIGKAVANLLGTGLIKFDTAKVFAGIVGESVAPWTEFTFYDAFGQVLRMTAEEAYEHRNSLMNMGTQSFTRDLKAEFLPVTDVIRHKRTKNLVRVTTKSGRCVDVTEDHSLFTISDEGKLKELTPSNMIEGSIIGVPANYAKTNTLKEINLLKLIYQNNEKNKWLLVNPLDVIGDEVFTITDPKSHKQYREGRPLNIDKISNDMLETKGQYLLSDTTRIKALMTDKEHPVILHLTSELLELFGWYTAEGSTTADRLRLHIHNKETEVVENLIKQCGYECYHYQDKDTNGVTVFFGDTGLKRIFDYLGLTSKDRVSSWILGIDESLKRKYIKGLFSGDGGISGNHIEFSQKSKTFCDDVLGLLSSVGIFASVYSGLDGGNRIIIHSSVFKRKYMKDIGFTQDVKNDLLIELFSDDEWGHKVPFFKDLKEVSSSHLVNVNGDWISYKNAIKINPNLKESDVYWDVVKSIEILEDQPEYVYDISVPGNENFIAGNIICHNSEKRMRQALTQLEAVGGVALMDEIDKALSGAGSSDRTDGGTTSRVIGTLIQWLQEPHPGVFLVATANDITNLVNNHPELLRKGRFDEIWFVDAPTEDERKEIFKIHLRKRSRKPENFDLDKLAKCYHIDDSGTKFPYTGSEIEYAIIDAIKSNFSKQKLKRINMINKTNSKEYDINTDMIKDKLKLIIPISKTGSTAVNRMRKFARERARNVSTSKEKASENTTGTKRVNLRKTKKSKIEI